MGQLQTLTLRRTKRFAVDVLQRGLASTSTALSISSLTMTSSKHSLFASVQGNNKENKSQKRSSTYSNQDKSYQLCFLHHGQSTWNRDNRFIGWTDTPLTDEGILEARVAGKLLKKSEMLFDEVHTSLLRRCIRTANLSLMELGQEYVPVYKTWRLNERSYGDLVGRNKKEVVIEHGTDQVKRWRRGYDEPPPPIDDSHPYHPALDPRYRLVRMNLNEITCLPTTFAYSLFSHFILLFFFYIHCRC